MAQHARLKAACVRRKNEALDRLLSKQALPQPAHWDMVECTRIPGRTSYAAVPTLHYFIQPR